jgi:glycine cleavage system H protein
MDTSRNEKPPQAAKDESSLKCCWMLAGVVAYKLCDRQYECETCSFDQAMGGRLRQSAAFAGRPSEGAESLLFHDKHVWARIEAGGRVRTGLDDFGRRLAGRIYCVDLPEPGARVAAGGAAWTIVHHEGEISIASPVSGIVEEVNGNLRQNPALVNHDPYGAGWAVMVTPVDLVNDLRHLRYGPEAVPWMAAEAERLSRELTHSGSHWSLPDGGRLIADLHEAIPQEIRARVLDLFLSADASLPPGPDKAGTAGK